MISGAAQQRRRFKSNYTYYSVLAILALGATCIIGLVLSASSTGRSLFYRKSPTTPDGPIWSLLVTLTFTETKYKEQFVEYFKPLAKYIEEEEIDTVAYEVLLSDKDPLRVLVFERYKDKENAFLKVHRNSQPFLDYRPKVKAMMDAGHVTQDGESFYDSMIGFGDRVA